MAITMRPYQGYEPTKNVGFPVQEIVLRFTDPLTGKEVPVPKRTTSTGLWLFGNPVTQAEMDAWNRFQAAEKAKLGAAALAGQSGLAGAIQKVSATISASPPVPTAEPYRLPVPGRKWADPHELRIHPDVPMTAEQAAEVTRVDAVPFGLPPASPGETFSDWYRRVRPEQFPSKAPPVITMKEMPEKPILPQGPGAQPVATTVRDEDLRKAMAQEMAVGAMRMREKGMAPTPVISQRERRDILLRLISKGSWRALQLSIQDLLRTGQKDEARALVDWLMFNTVDPLRNQVARLANKLGVRELITRGRANRE